VFFGPITLLREINWSLKIALTWLGASRILYFIIFVFIAALAWSWSGVGYAIIVIGIGKPPIAAVIAACPLREVAILFAILCLRGVFWIVGGKR
jgi:hypothetical protein